MPPLDRRQLLAAAIGAPLTCLPGAALTAPAKGDKVNVQRLRAASDLLDRLVDEGRIPGGAVRIARHGEVLFEHHAGKADLEAGTTCGPDTLYRLYSMTKPVTAAAIMLLVDDGELELSDPVAEHVPEFERMRVYQGENDGGIRTEAAQPMQVIDLLRHTSGLANSWYPGPLAPLYRRAGLAAGYTHDPDVEGLADVAARMAGLPLAFQPGTRWLYSIATDIAGLIVERVAGRSFGTFLEERLFRPLGMRDTGFRIPAAEANRLASMYSLAGGKLTLAEAAADSAWLGAPSVESGSSGLLSTAADYGRFASMLAGLGRLGDVRVMRTDSARIMMSAHAGPEVIGDTLDQFMGFGAGDTGGGMRPALGGVVLEDPDASDRPGMKGEYGWGGAASTTFFVVPGIGLDAVLMTQLFPSGTLPLRDMLKAAVYPAIG